MERRQYSPNLCDELDASFFIERAFVSHMNLIHNVDLEVEEKPPAYKAYLPVLHYFDPETGRGFYTEPRFVNWMKYH